MLLRLMLLSVKLLGICFWGRPLNQPSGRTGGRGEGGCLYKRLFRYRCSYMIYSTAFQNLPPQVRDRVLERLREVLTSEEREEKFSHLKSSECQRILGILRDHFNPPGFAGGMVRMAPLPLRGTIPPQAPATSKKFCDEALFRGGSLGSVPRWRIGTRDSDDWLEVIL